MKSFEELAIQDKVAGPSSAARVSLSLTGVLRLLFQSAFAEELDAEIEEGEEPDPDSPDDDGGDTRKPNN